MVRRSKALDLLERHKEDIGHFGVKRIGVFGSFARQTPRKGSDVDVLVEFKAGEKTFDHYMDLKAFLEKLLRRKVDLVTKSSLKPRIRTSILKETQYAGS